MELNRNITDYIERQAISRGWTSHHTPPTASNAELARQSGLTEATWSRIMRLQQKSIKDNVAAIICKMFDITTIDLLHIAHPEDFQKQPSAINEGSVAYSDRHDELASWLRSNAPAKAIDIIYSTAELAGFNPAHTQPPNEQHCDCNPKVVGLRPGLLTPEAFIEKQKLPVDAPEPENHSGD